MSFLWCRHCIAGALCVFLVACNLLQTSRVTQCTPVAKVQRECVHTRTALHASVLIAGLRPEYGLGDPSGDAADARSLFVSLATNADECDVAT